MTWERRSPDDEDLYRLAKVGLTVREIAAKHGISKSVVAARVARYKKNVLGPRAEADVALAAERENEAKAQERMILRLQKDAAADPNWRSPERPRGTPDPLVREEELRTGAAGFRQWLDLRDRDNGVISQVEYAERAAAKHRLRRPLGSSIPLDPTGRRTNDA